MTLLSRYRSAGSSRGRRPRAVWAAFATSTVLAVLIAVGVLVPILTLIGTVAGATVGTLRVPVGQIVLAIVVGYGLALILLVLCVRRRSGPLAWVLGVAAVISVLLVSLWPLVAVAIAGVGQVQDIVPFIQGLITRFMNR